MRSIRVASVIKGYYGLGLFRLFGLLDLSLNTIHMTYLYKKKLYYLFIIYLFIYLLSLTIYTHIFYLYMQPVPFVLRHPFLFTEQAPP
jgi:hypothetical protein